MAFDSTVFDLAEACFAVCCSDALVFR